VASVGFDWEDDRSPRDKVREELEEIEDALASGDSVAIEEEIGDLLFAAVNLARFVGAHPTTALARANAKFRDRFERLENEARERGVEIRSASLDVLDALWAEIKRRDG